LGRSFGQVFKTTILGRSSGQKRKKSKIDSQQKRWKQRFFFVFWVGTVSNYCCNNFSTKKSRYLKKYGQKMSAHFFDSVQKPGKTVFNFWIQKKLSKKVVQKTSFHFSVQNFCPKSLFFLDKLFSWPEKLFSLAHNMFLPIFCVLIFVSKVSAQENNPVGQPRGFTPEGW